MPKKYRVPKRPHVALKKPLPLTKEEDVEDKDKEEDTTSRLLVLISSLVLPLVSSISLSAPLMLLIAICAKMLTPILI